MNKNTDKNTHGKKKFSARQIAAIACIVVLVLLYVVTLITAFFDSEQARTLFSLCFFATIALPLVLWIYIWIYGKLTGKSTVADFHIGKKSGDKDA